MTVPTLPEPAWLKKLMLRLDALGEVSTLRSQLALERERTRRLTLHRADLIKMLALKEKERAELESIIIDMTGKFKAPA